MVLLRGIRFLTISLSLSPPSKQVALLAVGASAAPAHHLAHGYAAAPAVAHVATRVHQAPPVAHVAESYHAGTPVAHTRVQHGVVGHQTVQVGSRPVQVGVEQYVAGQSVHQPATYSVVAEPAKAYQNTVPIAEPALPYAAPVAPIIPPAPRNLGPAPADTVTQQRIAAPVRTHTIVTPRKTQIVPQLQVNKVPYDVPVQVPVPVQREGIVDRKVHQVKQVVQTPVINEHITTHTHSAPAVAAYAAAPAVAYAAAPAVAHAAAPAIAAVHH